MASIRKKSHSPTFGTSLLGKTDDSEMAPILPTNKKDVEIIDERKNRTAQFLRSKRFIISVGALICVTILWHGLQSMGKDGKMWIKHTVNNIWHYAEEHQLYKKAPAFDLNYAKDYPAFHILEDNYEVIRQECEQLLKAQKDHIPTLDSLGQYTKSGIHNVKWTTFFFKLGFFIKENESLAPKTAALLHKIPNLYTAFFSVMDPHQHIKPHWGYYKGYLRYHMGVIVPNNNEDKTSYLRVNVDAEESDENKQKVRAGDTELIDAGETYYWKNGEGVMFDDVYLHDAHNDSDEVRVVLFLDVARKLPWYLHIVNKISLFVAMRESSVKGMREKAVIKL
jgi:aspartyl/asparaginyl beta-hydroxylase (cupin superfamily)